MKIAELFVALGFDIKGDKTLQVVEKNLMKAEGASVALLAGVSALNIAFYAMINSAAQAATTLEKFRSSTGLNPEELERYQQAAQRFGIAGDEVMKTIVAIQTAQKNVMLGQGDFSPFQFFGVSVSQNPFAVLDTLHQKFQGMDPAFARIMAARLGISENLFQWLRRNNLELDRFNEKLLLTNAQQKNLWNLNKAWQDVLFTLSALKNKFAEGFAEPLAAVLKLIKNLLTYGADFIEWLNGTTVGANIVKTGLLAMVGALTLLMVVLTGLSVVLGTVAVAVKILALGLAPLAVAAAPVVLAVVAVTAALAGLFLLWDDYMTAVKGGKSLFDWNDNLILSVKNFERVANAIGSVIDAIERLKKLAPDISVANLTAKALTSDTVGGWALRKAAHAMGGGSSHQENNTTIHIDGAQDPHATGREVGRHMQNQLNDASGTLRNREY